MVGSYSILLLTIHFILQLFSPTLKLYSPVEGQQPLAPALYIFGDSLLDSGNNDFLNTTVKANYNPYGIDFPFGATGRFTNGRTAADFTAESLRLPYVPSYLGLSEDEKSETITGVNYASGGAGILNETGTALGKNLCLEDQIEYFQKTLVDDLSKKFETTTKLYKYLAKSIFMINIGSNDYINNYLQPTNYNSSKIYTPHQFAAFLVNDYEKYLMKLYDLGARKFVLFGLGAIGCIPAVVNSADPRPNETCVETVNSDILLFNARLPVMIRELKSILPGSAFVFGDIYKTNYETNLNPTEDGFTAGSSPCCVVGGNGTSTCIPNDTPCADRGKYMYYDAFHPTEVINLGVSKACFNESSPCVPMNIQQLTQWPYVEFYRNKEITESSTLLREMDISVS